MNKVITWFEIPTTNFDRAKKFYESIFDIKMHSQEMGGFMMGFFPMLEECVGGAIIKGEGSVPSKEGVAIYLYAGDDLTVVLNKVDSAGGKVVCSKTQITPEIGYFAFFLDTEGNKIGLHSQN